MKYRDFEHFMSCDNGDRYLSVALHTQVPVPKTNRPQVKGTKLFPYLSVY